MTKADRAVTTAAIITMGSTVAESWLPPKYGGKGNIPSPRLLFGGALTFAGLSLLGQFAPNLAIGLSAAIGFTAASMYGIPVLDCYTKGGCEDGSKLGATTVNLGGNVVDTSGALPLQDSPTPPTVTTVPTR